MSTKFLSPGWRMPRNANQSKFSNYSMSFGGTQYIDAGTGLGDSLGTYTGDASISLWFKANTTTSNDGLFSITPFNGSYFGSLRISLYNNGLYFSGNSTNGSTPVNYKYTSFSDTTNWHHVVCIFKSGDITNSKIYLDGVEQTTTDVGTFASSLSLTGFKTIIGAYRGTVNTFNGFIDGVAIFDYALSSSQVTTLWGGGTSVSNPMALPSPPIAYYPLGESAGGFVGGSGTWLTENNAIGDYVFDFGGSNDYINVGDVTYLDGASELTLSAWVKPTSHSGNVLDAILSKDGPTRGFHLGLATGNKFRFLVSTTGTTVDVFNSNASYTNGKWYYLAATWDGSNMKIYINGSEDNSITTTNATGTLQNNANPFEIGENGNYAGPLDGFLSNAQIWDKALSSTEVETLYNYGSPIRTLANIPQNSNIQGWWKLDASDTYDSSTGNWTIEDHAGSNDGTSSEMSQANLVQSDLQTVAPYSKYAIKFEAAGGNERIEGIGNTLGNGFSELSISAWVKYSSSPGNQYWPIIAKSSGNGTSFQIQNMRSGASSNGGELYFNVQTQNGSFNAFSGVLPSTNVWYNITGTYDGNEVKIYINNVLKGVSAATGAINTNNSQVWIGDSGYGGYSVMFKGIMSNVSVWNTGLTSSQVSEIYNQGLPGNLNSHSAYSNLVSWWQLGENSSFNGNNWLFADEKGSNNGESVNMTISDLVNGVGTTANGVSNGMSEGNLVGDAPYSTANAISSNMVVTSRVTGSGNTP